MKEAFSHQVILGTYTMYMYICNVYYTCDKNGRASKNLNGP